MLQFDNKPVSSSTDYSLLNLQLEGLIDSESDSIANMANCAALLWQELDRINWVGFYLLKESHLVLGPFQGKPACTRIDMGKGVCGTAALLKKTQLVDDVHQFPGHIACDVASNSEIVVPLIKQGQLLAVLDIDSPLTARFDHSDQQGLEQLMQILIKKL